MPRRADFAIIKLDATAIWIADLDQGGVSITNDAEGVCRRISAEWPNRRIYYRDTMDRWDELAHRDGVFLDFKPGAPKP